MNYENYLKEIFESIEDYRKIVLLKFLKKNDKVSLHEIGFSERDNICFYLEF